MTSCLWDAALVLAFHSPFLLPPLLAYVFVLLAGWRVVSALVCGFALVLVFDKPQQRLGRPWPWFCRLPFWRTWASYYPARLVHSSASTPRYDCAKPHIVAIHPHGCLGLSRLVIDTVQESVFPFEHRTLGASILFWIPFLREVALWTHLVSADRATAHRVLNAGISLVLYPGGIAEQVCTQRGKESIYLKTRKGFVRLALQHGASLVPVYVFGAVDVYTNVPILSEQQRLNVDKLFRIATLFPWGRFGIMPHRTPVTLVAGEPIAVDKIENPTPEQVDSLHETYVRAVTTLFEEHKDKYCASKGRTLEIR